MKLLSRLSSRRLSASRYELTFAGMATNSKRWRSDYSGGIIKAFLRLLVTGALAAGNGLPAANFLTKTM